MDTPVPLAISTSARATRLLVTLIVALWFAPSAAETREPDFLAANLRSDMLHTVDDYLADLPEDVLSGADRSRLKQSAKVEIRDGVSNDGSTYYALYQFTAPGLLVLSGVDVLPTPEAAQKAAQDLMAGSAQGHQKRGAAFSHLAIPEEYAFEGAMIVSKNPEGALVGNSFFIWRNRNVYRLTVAGAGAFVDSTEAAQFVATKAEAMLAFSPDTGALSLKDAAKLKAQGRNVAMTMALLVFYTIAYLVVTLSCTHVRWLRGRMRVNPRVAGLAAVLAMSIGICVFMMNALDRNDTRFKRLTPFDQGQLEGYAYGTAFFPAVLVLLAVGASAGVRQLGGKSQRPRS